MPCGGNNIYFSAQTNDLSGTVTTYLSAPISWTTNYFHHVAITYSTTNTALYLDGGLVTNGPPMTVYPGPDVLSNGFCIGSDTNGIYQAHGLFDSVATYNVPLDAATVQQTYQSQLNYFEINPRNTGHVPFDQCLAEPFLDERTRCHLWVSGNLTMAFWGPPRLVVTGQMLIKSGSPTSLRELNRTGQPALRSQSKADRPGYLLRRFRHQLSFVSESL